ncbi:pre-peptidase C-terminal domain-containing protein [Oscillatoria sp. FACHB-1407]|uniref:C2 family cysteine protease n=1 Tax=Oscillatoria sp. FACHB-1407 TaxID=2692847 RepID=UPI001681F24F|nr:C2 family cysteine protease [Oscillatoria sp. FACHB-1407]MBD2461865.1 pre-peptidase C-terminal domain-containing protein [Oscillatoria sp. FACHB-1407]
MQSKFRVLERSNTLRANSLQSHRSSQSALPLDLSSDLGTSQRHARGFRASAANQFSSSKSNPRDRSERGFLETSTIVANNVSHTLPISDLVVSDLVFNDLVFLPLADNSMSEANNLGTLGSSVRSNGFVGGTDSQDYFRFSNTTAGRFNLSLTGMSADADVQLLNSSGAIVASSSRGSTGDESINLASLSIGDYYVRVYQFNGDTNYTLRMSNTFPSNLLPAETSLGTLNGTRVFSNSVGSSDTADVYQFNLAGTANRFNITLSGLSSDADVRLIWDGNSNGRIDTDEVLGRSTAGSQASEWIGTPLNAGNYFVQVYQFSGEANYNLSVSTGDWYNEHLSDAGVIGQARALYWTDGSLSRNDMISMFREVQDQSSIDSTELQDLRKVVNPSTGFSMPDYVRNLSNKVVNGDPANPRSGIGNLSAGSSSNQMERLIGKWFLGSDRPTAISYNRTITHGYRYLQGSLFQNGISFEDVDQNDIGDCYFMAALGAAAFRSPSTIQNMFIDNGDGTFTVRFYRDGVADYLTVDRFVPTDSSGNAVFAGWGGGVNTEANNELWVALAEKAYAQLNESGWIGQDNTNSYNGLTLSTTAVSTNSGGINGGWAGNGLRHITGRNTENRDVSWRDWWSLFITTSNDLDRIISTFNAGRMVTLSTKDSGVESGVVANHVYTMVGYNASTQRFRLYNPWGNTVELTRNQIVNNFEDWDYTTT